MVSAGAECPFAVVEWPFVSSAGALLLRSVSGLLVPFSRDGVGASAVGAGSEVTGRGEICSLEMESILILLIWGKLL